MNETKPHCSKCREPMPSSKLGALEEFMGLMYSVKFVATAWYCPKCEHYNDLKRRKPHPIKEPS